MFKRIRPSFFFGGVKMKACVPANDCVKPLWYSIERGPKMHPYSIECRPIMHPRILRQPELEIRFLKRQQFSGQTITQFRLFFRGGHGVVMLLRTRETKTAHPCCKWQNLFRPLNDLFKSRVKNCRLSRMTCSKNLVRQQE